MAITKVDLRAAELRAEAKAFESASNEIRKMISMRTPEQLANDFLGYARNRRDEATYLETEQDSAQEIRKKSKEFRRSKA